jgi:hypothetical protein
MQYIYLKSSSMLVQVALLLMHECLELELSVNFIHIGIVLRAY